MSRLELLKQLVSKKAVKLSTAQIQEVSNLTFPDGRIIFDAVSPSTFNEILQVLINSNYQEILQYLTTAQNDEDLLWKQPGPAFEFLESSIHREEEMKLDKPIVGKGIGKCKFCGSEDLLSIVKQTRSGDEGQSALVQCVRCGRGDRKA